MLKRWEGWNTYKGDDSAAIEYYERAISILKEVGLQRDDLMPCAITSLYLSYKKVDRDYNKKALLTLLEKTKNISSRRRDYIFYYDLYQLLEDTSYLETAYNQLKEKADVMEEELKAKFLSYPIPSAIVEEWEKVKWFAG